MKVGTLRSWSIRGFGFVAVTFTEVYFLHTSGIVQIPDGFLNPPVGAIVHFGGAPAVKGAKHPMAVNARVFLKDSPAAKEVL
jgi:hypothetical protein